MDALVTPDKSRSTPFSAPGRAAAAGRQIRRAFCHSIVDDGIYQQLVYLVRQRMLFRAAAIAPPPIEEQ